MQVSQGCGLADIARQARIGVEKERGTEGMPQAIGRMDIEAERRSMAAARALRPGEEGLRRLVEGIDRAGAERMRQRIDHRAAPVIQEVMSGSRSRAKRAEHRAARHCR